MSEPNAILEQIRDLLERPPPPDLPETDDEVGDRVGKSLMLSARLRQKELEAAGRNGKMKVDWNINVPTMLTIASMAVGALMWVNGLERRISASEQQLAVVEERARKYVPYIEAIALKNELQDSQNKVQEERIQNLAVALQDQRRTNSEIASLLGAIREDMATVRVKLSIEKPNARDR